MIEYKDIAPRNIDNYIRQERDRGVETIKWGDKWDLLQLYIKVNSLSFKQQKGGFYFMGVKHTHERL